ncbi:MAG: electron transfer flavoprotein subunit beta/FixA family protein [Meiothermus sp.]|uniref:electron transfer flavoprotein subunit beta/FixA family protein n=1 Tax=Meiothermus sp. TaxID=1955249 RepID=UPI0025EEF592|nr:electron transfer flavoprotein subunit beta/FixA family protein [Meiothermus sp.]MCS7057851.1 electron transfer flavoprotein subunit beta/FixA family protein [Meiothermus sp.]MCS7194273.1 electron transfer flavoprotein subunit beta/FixA family protein [Meiothermus sp.]MCX7739945.1 electron transfer flavoprotein subunit beta/FixA family protein [Meiothermus sp.]MDW8090793.1 electron transfer flavoprotein subunit beta/FixA family protein [Meiothermus sp.]MDW8480784.1 electron transfer flavopr
MKFLAVIRQVPDGESRLRIEGGKVDLSSVTMILDQMDEWAVEEVIRLQEKHGGESVVVALGPERFEDALRTALAMGIDRAIHLVAEGYLDPITQAEALAEVVRAEAPTLVFTGGQQADWDAQALGPALAEALGWPVVSWTTQVELEGETHAKARHDLDEGAEVVRVPLPAVFTSQQGLNEPRYPTLPGIMKAKRKELKKVPVSLQSRVEILEQAIQERARLNRMIDGKDPAAAAHELVRLLREEAKVI